MFRIFYKFSQKCFYVFITSIILSFNINAQICEVPVEKIVYVLGADGIPALTNPNIITENWSSNPTIDEFNNAGFDDNDLIIGVSINGEARAYPHNIFWWHEIVNDVLGGKEIAVTYCPLTGTGITYDRTFVEQIRTLGVSGKLYNNNLVMYDRISGTLFPQMCPKGVTDPLKNETLKYIPSIETTWGMWKKIYPNTSIIGFDTGYSRNYNFYPYGDYITNSNNILFGIQPDDSRLERKDMVLGIIFENKAKVYPYKLMENNSLINDVVGSEEILILYNENSQMAFAYSREINSQTHSFQISNIPGTNGLPFEFVDFQTASVWNIRGEAISGPLKGTKLQQIGTGYTGFWFAFGSFFPNIEIYEQDVPTDVEETESNIPKNFNLEQNYPNPFNPETTIAYQLPVASNVNITIYNILGQKVRTLYSGIKHPGFFKIEWDGKNSNGINLNSGLYFYRMETGNFTKTRTMILLK